MPVSTAQCFAILDPSGQLTAADVSQFLDRFVGQPVYVAMEERTPAGSVIYLDMDLQATWSDPVLNDMLFLIFQEFFCRGMEFGNDPDIFLMMAEKILEN